MTPLKIVLFASIVCNIGIIALYEDKLASANEQMKVESVSSKDFSSYTNSIAAKDNDRDHDIEHIEATLEEEVSVASKVNTLVNKLDNASRDENRNNFINDMMNLEENIEAFGSEEVAMELVDRYQIADTKEDKMELLALLNLAQSSEASEFFLDLIDNTENDFGFEKAIASDMLANSDFASGNSEIREKVIDRLYSVDSTVDKINFIKLLRNHNNLSVDEARYSKEVIEPLLSDSDHFIRSEAVKTLSTLVENDDEFDRLISDTLTHSNPNLVHTSINIVSEKVMNSTTAAEQPYYLGEEVKRSLFSIANNPRADMTMRYTALSALAMNESAMKAKDSAELYGAF